MKCNLLAASAVVLVVSAVRSAAEERRFPAVLPGTKRLTLDEPLDVVMVRGISRFAERELAASPARRAAKWRRDYSSAEAYEKSIAANRERFRRYIGAVDGRVPDPEIESAGLVAAHEAIQAVPVLLAGRHKAEPGPEKLLCLSVRWPVFDGVTAEGLLITPPFVKDQPLVRIVALPDADWTPEMFIGLTKGVPSESQIPRRLAENGCMVLIPTLISRDDEFSGHPDVAYTNQPHREFVYRMAFQMGRHVIGYEVQKVLAAVDALERMNEQLEGDLPIGVVGVGEGGLLALYSAAADPRIDGALVCGYFQRREDVWREPIYRNVWRLLSEFGDAELAGLVAPRPLVVEACAVPTVSGPPEPRTGRRGGAAPGKITTPMLPSVRQEFERAKSHYEKLKLADRAALIVSEDGTGPAGSDAALSAFLKRLSVDNALKPRGTPPEAAGRLVDAGRRQKRQLDELVEHTQQLYRRSARVRYEFWKNADRGRTKKFTPEEWEKFAEFYRNYVHEEMIGALPEPTGPASPRTRKIIDEPTHVGYEVVLDVHPAASGGQSTGKTPAADHLSAVPNLRLADDPGVIAGGILLLPKDLKEGEKRPVVVCQHGLEGTPMDTITMDESTRAWRAYKGFSTQLVKRGFIVYAPQNPYRGGDEFRVIQRKSNPLGRSLFSYIVRQHERTLEWLASLPYVDAQRIGFYGLSYGGKTAMRVPAILVPRRGEPGSPGGKPGYCLSICSADFNEWVRKCVINTAPYSYVFTGEYEMFEWNMGHVANYAELASLISPRPFMVERGHDDGVAPDEWVAWEYAKVRRHYAKLCIADRTEIEFFDGPHTIHGRGTFAFLHRHLKWSER